MIACRPYLLLLISTLLVSIPLRAQVGFQLRLDKPAEYRDRELRGEKTPQKKIRVPQRILQNTITRYNYFFNASNKLNEVINRAKLAFQDDYTKLLPFYNYTLEKTAEDGIQLDSIIWKSNSGIVLHDLRSDWTDDLYLLWGASYYFQRKFDSARILFQFINYSYAQRDKYGNTRAIGSAQDRNNALSISTPEKRGIMRKMISGPPPRRNDAFIWQVRNYIADQKLAEAASLIEALRRDPVFPERLREELHEVQAWWYYQQQNWDSAAHHLSLALGQASSQNERARWEYLLGQLYERSGKWTEAERFYSRSIPRTTNPILEIYARLGSIRTNRDGGKDEIENNIRELRQMAKRDKYLDYRDIIYFMAAQMQRQTGDLDATKVLLVNSVQVPANNPGQRNQAFEQLAQICLQRKEYRQAYNYFDSIRLDDPKLQNPDSIRQLKDVLGIIASQLEIIERQDSILRIIRMPEEERKDFIRKLVKEIRKKQGLKDEPSKNVGGGTTSVNNLFGGGGDQKGEWYFYNASSRSRGQAEFQARWGNRPNADNWRRSAVLNGTKLPTDGISNPGGNTTSPTSGVDFESLYASLPTSPAQQKKLHDSLQQAWFALGKTYIQRMEDCGNGTIALEKITTSYPEFQPMDEALFLLYYCAQRSGDSTRARTIRSWLEKDFPNAEKTNLIVTGKDPVLENQAQATALYQSIYEKFVAGQHNEALQRKKAADSLYGRNFWTPQLTYLEAIHHIQQRADSLAIDRLQHITREFKSSTLAPKAENLLQVLSRRDSIEQELRNWKAPVDTSNKKQPVDTLTKKKPDARYSFRADVAHQVVVILDELDIVLTTETKNAIFRFNRNNFFDKDFQLDLISLNSKQQLLLIGPFKDANEASSYLIALRQAAPTEVLSWLKPESYQFGLIDAENLQRVRAEKNFAEYDAFLRKEYPSLFRL